MSDPLELGLLARITVLDDLVAVYEMGLRPEHFEDPINQAVYGTAIEFWRISQMKHAPSEFVYQTEYGSGFTEKLPRNLDGLDPAWFLAQTLMNRFAKNTVDKIMIGVATDVNLDPQASLMQMASQALEAANSVAPRNARSDMSDFQVRRQRYMSRFDNSDPGMSLGVDELDDHTGGVRPGEICAVAGFTKTGKSWMLFNAAVKARRQGFTPLVMSLEMDVTTAEDRIDALFSGVSYNRLESAKLRMEEMDQLVAGQEALRELGPIFIEQPERGSRTVPYMAARCRQLGADYLIIDQLSWIDSVKQYTGDSAQRVKTSDLIFDLRDEISRSSAGSIATLLAVQHNRSAAQTGGRSGGARGALHTFAHSSMIEQTVDLALGLYRTDEQRIMNLMGIDVMGARRCDKAEFLLSWDLVERTEIGYRDRIDGAVVSS